MKITYLLLTEKNEVKKVKFRRSIEYAVTGLSINQDIDSGLIAVTDTDRQEAITNLIQRFVKEKKNLTQITNGT